MNSAHLKNALQEQGYRLTSARQIILNELVSCGGHITADGLAERVRRRSVSIGRMTVYRTLDLLCQLNLMRPVYQGTGAAHYVLLKEGHHHHLVCSMCGIVIEFDECDLDRLGEAISGRFKFQVQGHLLELFGKCQDCQELAQAQNRT